MDRAGRERALAQLLARLSGPFEHALRRSAVVKALGRRGLEAAVRDGHLVVLLPGVYVAATRQHEHVVRCAAVVVWSRGRVLISGESALHLKGGLEAPDRVRCVAPPQWSARVPAWVDLTRRPPPKYSGSAQMVDCVVPEDALLDAWARAVPSRRKSLLYEALWRRVVGPRRLVGAAARRTRLPDRAVFDGIMGEFLAGSTSPSEVMARREVFTGPEFAELEWHVEMMIAGRKRTADGLHRRARLDLELDGEGYHSSRDAVRRDRTRDAEFASEGWLPVRFSFADLRDRPGWCRDMLQRTMARRLTS